MKNFNFWVCDLKKISSKIQSENLDSEYLIENQSQNATAATEEALSTLFQFINDTLVNDTSTETIVAQQKNETVEAEATGIGFYNTIFLVIVATIGILAAITAGLLLHLCFFHIYISYLGLTTYEYIRNQRQATLSEIEVRKRNQQASKLNGPSSLLQFNRQNSKNQRQTIQNNTKTLAKEVYVCSKLTPNFQHRPKTLHCCEKICHTTTTASKTTTGAVSGTEYSHKAFYVCSLLEEEGEEEQENAVGVDSNSNSQTFHCCSEFLHSAQSHDEIETESIYHYTEQCTFCSFRIKTPSKTQQLGLQDKRCCMKTITKHHRWRRKWNCCSNVPDSPDVPGDPLRTVSGGLSSSLQYPLVSVIQPLEEDSNRAQSMQYVQIEVPHRENSANDNHIHNNNNINNSFTSDVNSNNNISNNNNNSNTNGITNGANGNHHMHHFSEVTNTVATCSNNHGNVLPLTNATNNKRTRPRLVRPWPVVRLRHMFRMIGRYRRPRCRGINSNAIKQNQIRPLPGSSNESNENSNPVLHSQFPPLPALPPPTRRKIKSPTDLQDLADTINFQPASRISAHSYRRNRRKTILRNRSPTLSPIHESGLSNPTSPQLCRHSCASLTSLGNSSVCGTVIGNPNRSA